MNARIEAHQQAVKQVHRHQTALERESQDWKAQDRKRQRDWRQTRDRLRLYLEKSGVVVPVAKQVADRLTTLVEPPEDAGIQLDMSAPTLDTTSKRTRSIFENCFLLQPPKDGDTNYFVEECRRNVEQARDKVLSKSSL